MDGAGSVYVADGRNYVIRKIDSAGAVSTLAGQVRTPGFIDGAGAAAQFSWPTALAVDSIGNVDVADSYTIRKITPAGRVTTVAGEPGQQGSADGSGRAARFRSPGGLAVDGADNVYVADSGDRTIRRISPVLGANTK